jgi:hypothetical protein
MTNPETYWALHRAGCSCLDPLLDLCNLEPGPEFEDRIRVAIARATVAEDAA